MKQTSAWCPICNQQVYAVGRTPNHTFHLLMTIFTFGIWWVVWFILLGATAGNYRCTRCGSRVSSISGSAGRMAQLGSRSTSTPTEQGTSTTPVVQRSEVNIIVQTAAQQKASPPPVVASESATSSSTPVAKKPAPSKSKPTEPSGAKPKASDGCPNCGRKMPGNKGKRYCMICDVTY
jgi:hypothetical protein